MQYELGDNEMNSVTLIFLCFLSPYQPNILGKDLAAAQDMNMLCCRQEKKKGKYPPVVFIRQREWEVYPVLSLSYGDTLCAYCEYGLQFEEDGKHSVQWMNKNNQFIWQYI